MTNEGKASLVTEPSTLKWPKARANASRAGLFVASLAHRCRTFLLASALDLQPGQRFCAVWHLPQRIAAQPRPAQGSSFFVESPQATHQAPSPLASSFLGSSNRFSHARCARAVVATAFVVSDARRPAASTTTAAAVSAVTLTTPTRSPFDDAAQPCALRWASLLHNSAAAPWASPIVCTSPPRRITPQSGSPQPLPNLASGRAPSLCALASS
mmetsp:Transcript_4620/g.13869  ORF Transcript_4620/g.13869 Transcript_4620/m.13869 type:complete len:213 (+) Transcript_4620:2105-2743(+)